MEIERTVSQKGQIVIPKDVRKHLGIKAGSGIVFVIKGKKVMLKLKAKPKEFVDDFVSTPKKVKGIDIKRIKQIIEDEHEVR